MTVALDFSASLMAETQVIRENDNGLSETIAVLSAGETGYIDTTAETNRIYRYSLKSGACSTPKPIIGVQFDKTKAFKYPPLARVPDSLLGIDRSKILNLPDGTTKTITVRAPVAKPTVIDLADSGDPATNFTNLNAALASIAASGGKVRLPAGKFRLHPGTASNNIVIGSSTDVILEGAPLAWSPELQMLVPQTWVVFSRGTYTPPALGAQGLGMGAINRVLIKNIIFDWDFPNAIPGVVTTVSPTVQKMTITNGPYYIPNPASPPVCHHMRGYHHAEKVFDQRNGSRLAVECTFNPNFANDGLYHYTFPGNYFPDNTEAICWVKGSHGINLGAASKDVSLEDVWLVGGGGGGLLSGTHDGGIRLSNCRFMRKPDELLEPGEEPRFVSFFGDSDSYSTYGNIIIENSRITDHDDDIFWFRGPMPKLQTLASTTGFVISRPDRSVNHTLTPGLEAIQFYDPHTLAEIASVEPQSVWTSVSSPPNWVFTCSFDAVPELVPYIGLPEADLPYFSHVDWCAGNFAITDCQFGNSFGRLLIRTRNGLIEHCLFANMHYHPILLDCSPKYDGVISNGPPPKNITVRSNIFIGTGAQFTDYNWKGELSIEGLQSVRCAAAAVQLSSLPDDGFQAEGFPVRWVIVEDNHIAVCPGIAIGAYACEDVKIRFNVIVNANSIPFLPNAQALYCGPLSQPVQDAGANQPWCVNKVAAQGSIMTAWSRRVEAMENVFGGTSEGVFADPASTSEITIGLPLKWTPTPI